MTHAQLIELSSTWLQAQGCSVVITDMTHGQSETPDAIGWKGIVSTLLECKASRADFLADKHKGFRRDAERGMGQRRYYVTPPGLLRPEELPPGWGLLEEHQGRLKRRVESTPHSRHGASAEISLLLSALRRIGQTCPAGVAVRAYSIVNPAAKNRATLGILPLDDDGLKPELPTETEA